MGKTDAMAWDMTTRQRISKALFGRDYKLDYYVQIIIQIIQIYQIYAKSRSALGCIHIPLNQTRHDNVHFVPANPTDTVYNQSK
jgi:hypothetical protein